MKFFVYTKSNIKGFQSQAIIEINRDYCLDKDQRNILEGAVVLILLFEDVNE